MASEAVAVDCGVGDVRAFAPSGKGLIGGQEIVGVVTRVDPKLGVTDYDLFLFGIKIGSATEYRSGNTYLWRVNK